MPDNAHDHLPSLDFEIQDFILDRRVKRVSARTIEWYEYGLAKWQPYCLEHGATATEDVDTRLLRQFILRLEAAHNRGGVSSIYRAVKAFLLWYEAEYETGWKSPTRKISIGNGDDEPLEPLSLEAFHAMLAACERKTLAGDRDRALLYVLLDTGIRKQEATDLSVGDVDLSTGAISIRRGKGGKQRSVFAGVTARRALLRYLRHRGALTPDAPLWIGKTGKKLNASGIRQIIRRRAVDAGIPEPGLHSFRRAFAINYLRNGGDVVTLQRLLGHSTLAVINRYLKLLTDDLQVAHAEYGVVDNL